MRLIFYFLQNIAYLKKLSDEFSILENNDEEAVFVNLLENKERFTGYTGDNAVKVWKIIYDQNCFASPQKQEDFLYSNKNQFPLPEEPPDKCIETKIYYRLISGLHASISIHIALDFYYISTGKWGKNFELFHDRVGAHPDRIKNLFFLYMVVVINLKITPSILSYCK